MADTIANSRADTPPRFHQRWVNLSHRLRAVPKDPQKLNSPLKMTLEEPGLLPKNDIKVPPELPPDSPNLDPTLMGEDPGDPLPPGKNHIISSWRGCILGLFVLVLFMAGLGYFGWRMFSPSTKRREIQVDTDSAEVSTLPAGMNARIPKGLTPTPTFTPSPTLPPTATPTQTPTPTITPSPTPIPDFGWNHQVLQPALAVGAFTSLAIDSQGFMHILYFQDNNDVIWYAHNETGDWIFDYVQGEVGHGFHLSMVLDLQDKPHFAYNNVKSKRTRAFLWYRSLSDLGWNGPFREGTHTLVNSDVSMDLGPDGLAYFSYQTDSDLSLMLGQFSQAAGYSSQKVGDAGEACRSLPIKVDSQGNVHMCYCSDAGLIYAVHQDQEWTLETVDPGAGAGVFVDLALDLAGNPYLAYYDQDTRTLNYANRGDNSWHIQLIDADGDVGQYPSLALNPFGSPHISYYDATNKSLKYAYWQDSIWSIQTIDSEGNVGMFNSLALDPITGEPRISYFDALEEDLKIAIGFHR